MLPARRLLAAALVMGAAVAIAIVVVALRGGDEAPAPKTTVAMKQMTPDQLETFSRTAGHTIFWAGERAGARMSAGRNAQGTVVVNYQAEAGSELDGVMIATYPMPDAAANLRRQAERDPRFELAESRDGRLILIDRERAEHAYLAEPGADQQIEIHSPVGDHALRLVTEGRIIACCGA
jgi:hypothetical protein